MAYVIVFFHVHPYCVFVTLKETMRSGAETMPFFEQQVKTFIHTHQLIQSGDHVAAAVSGGSDSMALLHFLYKNQSELAIHISAIHVDHMLRGNESYEDLLFVKAFCRERNISFKAGRVDAGAEAIKTGVGIQEAARSVRYSFFEQVVKELGAAKLATAHHADDQIETVFMQLTRGSHAHTGIPAERPFAEGAIIRPFLTLTKEDILTYCASNNIQYRDDPSNEKNDYTRNRFRHNLLPFIKKENKKAHFHVQRFSEVRREDEEFLTALAQQEIEKMTIWKHRDVSLKTDQFKAVPLPLQRRAIHLILNYLYHGKTAFSFLHIQHILQLLQSSAPSGKLNLPSSLTVQKNGSDCLFSFETDESKKKSGPLFLFPGDVVQWPSGGTFMIQTEGECLAGSVCFQLDPDHIQWPICIRMRQDGDKIQLKGMSGSKKLARLFIDEKIPLAYRDDLPIVTDADGTVLWVPGIRKSIHERSGPLLLIYEKE
jgi:tRNA(Ile)-lysidine synthase